MEKSKIIKMETQESDTPWEISTSEIVAHIFTLCIMNQKYMELGWNINVIFV